MIRLAKMQDLPAIEKVYAAARAYMAASGNPHQWGDGHPARSILENDIEKGDLYVCEIGGEIRIEFFCRPVHDKDMRKSFAFLAVQTVNRIKG